MGRVSTGPEGAEKNKKDNGGIFYAVFIHFIGLQLLLRCPVSSFLVVKYLLCEKVVIHYKRTICVLLSLCGTMNRKQL